MLGSAPKLGSLISGKNNSGNYHYSVPFYVKVVVMINYCVAISYVTCTARALKLNAKYEIK